MSLGTITLILGGVRSGKSAFAERLATELGGESVLFVATAEPRDDEMRHRIRKHRESRPSAWQTLEATKGIANHLLHRSDLSKVVLIDCLTLLVTNHLCTNEESENASDRFDTILRGIHQELDGLFALVDKNPVHIVIVSGEVGLGIVPENRLAREFRDLLGWANQSVSHRASATYMMMGGHALPLHRMAETVGQVSAQLNQVMQSQQDLADSLAIDRTLRGNGNVDGSK